MMKAQNIRPSAIAGRWYPGTSARLRSEIDGYLALADPASAPGDLLGIVVPHAGYLYSGQTAAYAFKLLQGKSYERVVVCSPFHAMTFEALLTTAYSGYETPLGTVPVDEPALEQIDQYLETHHMQKVHRVHHEQEHSLEIELPFLQAVLEDRFDLVPLMVRTHQPDALRILAAAIAELAQEKPTLLVASSDLSHFHPANTAEKLDHQILSDIQHLLPDQLLEDNQKELGSACGAGAVALMLFSTLLAGANHADILHYSHSGNTTGDYDSVVGYGAAAIYRQEGSSNT